MDESLVLSLLARFHREVILPDIVREIAGVRTELSGEIASLRTELSGKIGSVWTDLSREIVGLRDEVSREIRGLRDEMAARLLHVDGHFDALYMRFDKLETEYHMLVAAVRRLERRPPS
jgi:hypothetical protein